VTASAATAAALVCLVVHQLGVVRDIKPDDVRFYRMHSPVDGADLDNLIVVPCDLSDSEMLKRWLQHLRQRDEELCPGCFPWR
jgi:hypothetical protein